MELIDKDYLIQYLTGMADAECCDDNTERIIKKFIIPHINTIEMREVNLEEEIIKECPFKKVGCEIYEGHILECKGACSWVVDHLKLKELKAQKGE